MKRKRKWNKKGRLSHDLYVLENIFKKAPSPFPIARWQESNCLGKGTNLSCVVFEENRVSKICPYLKTLLLVISFGELLYFKWRYFNSQNYFQPNYFEITKDLFKFTTLISIWFMTSLNRWKIRTWYNLKALSKNSHRPQYNRKYIMTLIFIEIWPALAEIVSK